MKAPWPFDEQGWEYCKAGLATAFWLLFWPALVVLLLGWASHCDGSPPLDFAFGRVVFHYEANDPPLWRERRAYSADLLRFPDEQAALDALRLAEAHLKWLDKVSPDHGTPGAPIFYAETSREWERWTSWHGDAQWCRDCWQRLVWCHQGSREAAVRGPVKVDYMTPGLLELEKLLGPVLYRAGAMPPPVPVWHFRLAD